MTRLSTDPPSFVVAARAFATPFARDPIMRVVSGCLYTAEGQKLSISERPSLLGREKVRIDNPSAIEIASDATFIPGKSLYLGHYMGRHYGHFLMESLSSVWAVSEVTEVDTFVYHPFVFKPKKRPFEREFLKGSGVDLNRVMIIERPTVFEQIVIPSRLVRINDSANVRMRGVYGRIADHFASAQAPARRLYLSRSRLGDDRRKVKNEGEVEQLFRERGFEVLHPQLVPLDRQIQLYANCRALAGFSGSALHNIVFAKPGTSLINLCDARIRARPHPNQEICNELSGAQCLTIPYTPGGVPGMVDTRAVRRALDAFLAQNPLLADLRGREDGDRDEGDARHWASRIGTKLRGVSRLPIYGARKG